MAAVAAVSDSRTSIGRPAGWPIPALPAHPAADRAAPRLRGLRLVDRLPAHFGGLGTLAFAEVSGRLDAPRRRCHASGGRPDRSLATRRSACSGTGVLRGAPT